MDEIKKKALAVVSGAAEFEESEGMERMKVTVPTKAWQELKEALEGAKPKKDQDKPPPEIADIWVTRMPVYRIDIDAIHRNR